MRPVRLITLRYRYKIALPVIGSVILLGFQSVLQAAKVGRMLIELKAITAHGEFLAKVTSVLLLNKMDASRLMTLARNMPMLEQHKPDSQRAG